MSQTMVSLDSEDLPISTSKDPHFSSFWDIKSLEEQKRRLCYDSRLVLPKRKPKPYEKWSVEQLKALLEGVKKHERRWPSIVKENPIIFHNKDHTSLRNKHKKLTVQ